MRILFSLVLAAHALLHLLGFAKGFGLAPLPQLTMPASRAAGLGWLSACALLLCAAASLWAWPRAFWIVGAAGLVLSQVLVCRAWADARFGTIPNVILLVAVAYGFLSQGPWSFQATYDREVAAGLARRAPQPPVTEADLAPLPPPVQRYLRLAGVVGQPRVQSMRLRLRGAFRTGPADPWMPITADQTSFFDRRTRLFHIRASRAGVPVEALHRMIGGAATFTVKVASLVPVADARGPEADRSEAVTFLNDMALLAPATLTSPALAWEPVDDRAARVTCTADGQTVRAELTFDADGWLTGFSSDDRAMASPDGKRFRTLRWSTPVHDRRSYGPVRLFGRAEAIWHAPEGAFEYARFELERIEYDVSG